MYLLEMKLYVTLSYYKTFVRLYMYSLAQNDISVIKDSKQLQEFLSSAHQLQSGGKIWYF